MKRGTPDHPKTLMLMAALELPKYAAVGLLETMWHFTARYAPAGNIGKFSDELVATSLGWDRDPSRLVAALVESGWLDEHKEHRLLVHDWPDHSDEAADKWLSEHAEKYADGRPTRRTPKVKQALSRQVPTSREKLSLPSSSSYPSSSSSSDPNPEPKKKARAADAGDPLADLPVELDTADCRQALTAWREYKAEKGQRYKPAGWAALLATCAKAGPAATVAAIERSMASNWAGLFPEKEDVKQNGKPKRSRALTDEDMARMAAMENSK
jgi:hypothetical protein